MSDDLDDFINDVILNRLRRPFGVACPACAGPGPRAHEGQAEAYPGLCHGCVYLADRGADTSRRDALREERIDKAPRPGVGEWRPRR